MGDRPVRQLGPVPRRNPRAAARVIAGEALILTPEDSLLHTLNPVATRVWELLEHETDRERLAETIAAEYDVSPETARNDIDELLASLVEKKVLVP